MAWVQRLGPIFQPHGWRNHTFCKETWPIGQLATLLYKCHHYKYKVEEVLNDINIEHHSKRNTDSSVALLSILGAKTGRWDSEGSAWLHQVILERTDPIAVYFHDGSVGTYQAELITGAGDKGSYSSAEITVPLKATTRQPWCCLQHSVDLLQTDKERFLVDK